MSEEKNTQNAQAVIPQDVTVQEILERKSRNLETIFDAVPVCMLMVDENLIVKRVNNAVSKMVEKDYSELIGMPIGEAMNCKTIAASNRHCGTFKCCNECLLTGEIRNAIEKFKSIEEFEFKSKIKFAHRLDLPWFSLSVKPIMVDGEKAAVVSLNDITERKVAEERLVETMEMKSQFISTVSHELRTPLTAIGEGINIVLEGVAGKVKKKQRHFLELSQRNVERLRMLINDILDFQKLESGRMCFEFFEENVYETMKEIYDSMSLHAAKHKIDYVLDVANDGVIGVFDRNRLIQALTNLLSNAIKFTPDGGRVVLKVAIENQDMLIEVSDTGLGIPKEDLQKIFERFFRVSRPGKEIQGTGLGLPIVEQVITRHGGTISVESEVGKGTKFCIVMPLKVNAKDQELIDKTDKDIEKIIS